MNNIVSYTHHQHKVIYMHKFQNLTSRVLVAFVAIPIFLWLTMLFELAVFAALFSMVFIAYLRLTHDVARKNDNL